jgi:shikimate dehydrogenase
MRKAAVIGHPIAHSLSPRLFAFWLKKYGIEGSYDAIDVAPENLKAFLRKLPASGLSGVNITVPHKAAVIPFLDSVDDAARVIGAVNMITVKDRKIHGTNSDIFGFSENLLACGLPLAKNKAVVLGAGGAAKAVVKALVDEGFKNIIITNRSYDKAKAIAKALRSTVAVEDWEDRAEALADCDVLVNATTLGMHNREPLELDLALLPKTAVVNDIVYAPLVTPLLAAAKARGNKTVDGLGMLIYQAVPAFEAWFGRRPEVSEDVRKAVLV